MPFSPLLPVSTGRKDGFVPLHVDEREAPVDDAGHLHLREQEVVLRGAAHARMSHSTGS